MKRSRRIYGAEVFINDTELRARTQMYYQVPADLGCYFVAAVRAPLVYREYT